MEVRRKFNLTNLLLVLVFSIGLGILLYPNISNYFNERNSSKATQEYDETVAQMNKEEREKIMKSASDYNKTLNDNPVGRFAEMSDAQKQHYMSELNVNGTGMMCYLKIDKLGVNLPVYHGTTEDVLQKYVGHVEGTSLPTGGLGTHCALSGHRGLPSAVLFTNLDQLVVGDYFTIAVLGEEHLYVIDQILTVLPDDMSPLAIDPNEDFITLITCTPYGVNTHRLMVRGRRVPAEEEEQVINEAEDNKMHFTREQIVNIIAAVMTVGFIGISIPILIFPIVPKKVIYLRPWDDNIEEVISSAIKVSERANRANWEMEDIAKDSDWLASLRRWDDTLREKNKLSSEDPERAWREYNYDDTSYQEEEEKRTWDDEILEKVDQDWAPINRVEYKKAIKYRDIDKVVEKGSAETTKKEAEDALMDAIEKEVEKGENLLQRIRARRKF